MKISETDIQAYASLFKGRSDVFAKRWVSKKTGKSGYSPVCRNHFKKGLCYRLKSVKGTKRCRDCEHKDYITLTPKHLESHLIGHKFYGIYPLLDDGTCHFLALDFDLPKGEEDEDLENPIEVAKRAQEAGARILPGAFPVRQGLPPVAVLLLAGKGKGRQAGRSPHSPRH